MLVPTSDSLGAFVPAGMFTVEGASSGPLKGLRFAAKDIFDVAGRVTGSGNPDWARTHPPPERHAEAVDRLLGAGAKLIGKTITDELAYSLNGQNFHYGTPANPNAPGRIPGGSSSGSASAVAGGAADFALGSDTGGSVRIPASYCGIFGLRPTHGRLSLAGVMPLAPSFDTVGWFARDAKTLRRVGEVLFRETGGQAEFSGLLIAKDAIAVAEPGIGSMLDPHIANLEARLGKADAIEVAAAHGGFDELMLGFRVIQAREIWASHGAWIEEVRPRFGPEIAERFAWVQTISDADAEQAWPLRRSFTEGLEAELEGGRLLCLPTAPGIAPLVDAAAEAFRDHRSRVLGLTSLANLSGLPQVTLPVAQFQGCPVGLSLIAGRGRDMDLLALTESFCPH